MTKQYLPYLRSDIIIPNIGNKILAGIICMNYRGVPSGKLTSLWTNHRLQIDFPSYKLLFSSVFFQQLPSGKQTQLLKMVIEIVDFPIKKGDFHSYVNVYQRVC